MTLRTLPVLLAAASLVGAGAAVAQPLTGYPASSEAAPDIVVTAPPWSDSEIRAEGVGFRDLNLSTHAGAYTLLRRIRGAAERVCSPPSTYPDNLKDVADYQRCFRRSVARAVNEVDAPTLEDVYYETEPGPAPYGE